MKTQPSTHKIDGNDSCIAPVTNRKYLRKCLSPTAQIRAVGEYKGVGVLVVGKDLIGRMSALNISGLGIESSFLGQVQTSEQMAQVSSASGGSGTEVTKRFPNHNFRFSH